MKLHFISGLPRSGSTLLAALLRQNPRFHAGMTSPVGGLFTSTIRNMSAGNEASVFIEDWQRQALLASIPATFYARTEMDVVFDTNRLWCSKLPAVARLWPDAKVICCVRSLSWILDSFERVIRKNAFEASGIFGFDPGGTVYRRVEGMIKADGVVGYAYDALKEAVFGGLHDRLVLVQFDSLTKRPVETLRAVYDFVGEPWFDHDPDNVTFEDAAEFDRRLGTPGLHTVGKRVAAPDRKTVLPPELFDKWSRGEFWKESVVPAGLKVI